MSDHTPLDLRPLDPGEPPDLVKGAIRRFRWRVVLFTTVSIVVAAVLAGWSTAAIIHARNAARARDLDTWLPAPQKAILQDFVGICQTPTYSLEDADVTLLGAVRMADGGWALHFVVRGNGRSLTVEADSLRFTTLAPVGGSRPTQVPAQPGATAGEAYIGVPASLGDRFDMRLEMYQLESRGMVAQSFTVDMGDPSLFSCY